MRAADRDERRSERRGGPLVQHRFLTCLLIAAASVASPLAAGADRLVNILTASGSSVYYSLGVALGDAIEKTMPSVKASVQTTKGSAENLSLLQAGRGEIAFALGDSLSAAWKGSLEAGFKSPLRKLRGIAALYPNYVHIVARADAGIRSLADLKGKKVSVGAPKSGPEINARAIFRAAGVSYGDFAKVEYLPFGESIELMKSRQIDATLQSAGLGASSLRDLATSVDIVVVPIPASVIRKAHDPAYLPATIPANTYRGQTADVASAVVRNFLVTHEDVSNDLAYGMTKALWSDLGELAAAHPAAKAIDIGHAVEGIPVPLHPGALRYYKEAGVLK
jgi:TRAP transporter TAXI family solute receptor